MFQNMYSIYDTVAEIFNKPFTEINNQSAIRAFTGSIKDNPNKNDFALYHVGAFDENSGSITADKQPLKIYSGLEVKKDNVTEITEAV